MIVVACFRTDSMISLRNFAIGSEELKVDLEVEVDISCSTRTKYQVGGELQN